MTDKEIWFPAKRYGWGWGFPIAWQGWVVLLAYLVLILAGTYILLPQRRALFGIFIIVLTIALVAICRARGEKPRWRWGDE